MLFLLMVTSALVASAVGAHSHRKTADGGDKDFFGVDGSARSRHDRSLLGSSDLAALEAGSGTHFALYIIIPFVSAIVAYERGGAEDDVHSPEFTLKLLKFAQPKGQPFGLLWWQGIIPAKAGKMAAILCDLMTSKPLDVKETARKIHLQRFAEALAPEMALCTGSSRTSLGKRRPSSGRPARTQTWSLVKQAMAGAPEFLADVIEDLQNHVYEVLDLKAMVVKLCEANKQDVGACSRRLARASSGSSRTAARTLGSCSASCRCVFYVVDTREIVQRPDVAGVRVHHRLPQQSMP